MPFIFQRLKPGAKLNKKFYTQSPVHKNFSKYFSSARNLIIIA